MRRKDQFDRDALHFAPFVLFPTSFPRNEFDKSVKLQQVLNELMHKVLFVEKQLNMHLQFREAFYSAFKQNDVILAYHWSN